MKKILAVLFGVVAIVGGALFLRYWTSILWINPSDPKGSGGVPALIQTSALSVPVQIKLKALTAIVNNPAIVPNGFSGKITKNIPYLAPNGPFKWHKKTKTIDIASWNVDHGEIVVAAGPNDSVSLQAPVIGSVKLGVTGKCSGTAVGSSTLTVTPDYNLNPSLSLNVNLNQASIAGISIKRLAQDEANKFVNNLKGPLVAEILKVVDLHKIAETAWNQLNTCVSVPVAKRSDIWLRISPQDVVLDGPHVSADAINATLSLHAKVETILQSSKPDLSKPVPLPNLTNAVVDPYFHIFLPVELQIKELNKILSDVIAHEPNLSKIKLDEKHTIKLSDVTMFPRGNRLFLKIAFECDPYLDLKRIKGTVIVGAVPKLDEIRQTLSFENVEFTPETKSAFLTGATWLFNPLIVHEIQKDLVVKLGTQIVEAKKEADELGSKIQLPAPLKLEFNLVNLSTRDIAIYGDDIFVNFDAYGICKVIVQE